ncbi:MAG: hypothetical protein HC790_13540 [Acaryochloridaceae cyanobacterium CSU_3_4]|nr:hypothetical protein [Acaryochloridaceae cyanobacterium CSU_3_4]
MPAGSQIHHITPRAVFRDSDLAQEWSRRGITGLNNPENLEALPQTKEAYDKSKIKVQHSGSHENWNRHATEVLDTAQEDLIGIYGSLDKVPDDVMKQRKNEIMQELRDDLHDKDLGIEEGWIKHMDNGMDSFLKLSFLIKLGRYQFIKERKNASNNSKASL